MRILYLDIDTLRADHLGCYGYHRATSPNIDRIAEESVRFERVYVSDAPCLPSRSALFSGRFGIHNGIVNHGGVAADPPIEGPSRGFGTRWAIDSWPSRLRRAGLNTATVSTFAERHSAFHWYAGFNEVMNVGKFGLERADEVAPRAIDWLRRKAARDDWFLHVHMWDPHTPYRAPAEYGDPFASEPLPAWLSEDVRARHWQGVGPHSAQESAGFSPENHPYAQYPRQPLQMASMRDVRRMIDGYDTGIRYADDHIGMILDALEETGVLEETAIILSSDHGETLGELNIYCDHHTADEQTSHVPLLIRWPTLGDAARGQVRQALHYQVDMAATVLELLDLRVPRSWDGQSFAPSMTKGEDRGRDSLVVSQGAWTCQRSARWDDCLAIRSLHDGYHDFPDVMVFDVTQDPHEQTDLSPSNPELARRGIEILDGWQQEMLGDGSSRNDPMQTVLREGGPFHVRGKLPAYLERLRATGRAGLAEKLAAAHPAECA